MDTGRAVTVRGELHYPSPAWQTRVPTLLPRCTAATCECGTRASVRGSAFRLVAARPAPLHGAPVTPGAPGIGGSPWSVSEGHRSYYNARGDRQSSASSGPQRTNVGSVVVAMSARSSGPGRAWRVRHAAVNAHRQAGTYAPSPRALAAPILSPGCRPARLGGGHAEWGRTAGDPALEHGVAILTERISRLSSARGDACR
jgi:hypothetical protein